MKHYFSKHLLVVVVLFLASIFVLPIAIITPAFAQSANLTRYPYRIPDWLWQDSRRSAIITPKLRDSITADIKIYEVLKGLDDSSLADAKESEIAARLSREFTLRDLIAGAPIVRNVSKKLSLAVQIDPSFDQETRTMLEKATQLYLQCALDRDVINTAIKQSTMTPTPMPAQYEMQEDKIATDKFGNNIYTSKYKSYLKAKHIPLNADSFIAELQTALRSTDQGDAGLLAISSYTGDSWWGLTYYYFFNTPEMQLSREVPTKGFLYIALNQDRMKAGEKGFGDAAFWASKIGHESLHALGYFHPAYKDAADRDANNVPNTKAFIVAYEQAIFQKAQKLVGK